MRLGKEKERGRHKGGLGRAAMVSQIEGGSHHDILDFVSDCDEAYYFQVLIIFFLSFCLFCLFRLVKYSLHETLTSCDLQELRDLVVLPGFLIIYMYGVKCRI